MIPLRLSRLMFILLILSLCCSLNAQEAPDSQPQVKHPIIPQNDLPPSFQQKNVALDISVIPRVVDSQNVVFWQQPLQRTTKPGIPVFITVEGESLRLKMTITPYVRTKDLLMVVQGDVMLKIGGQAYFRSSVQTLDCAPGEKLIFYPLGWDSSSKDSNQLLVEFVVKAHEEK